MHYKFLNRSRGLKCVDGVAELAFLRGGIPEVVTNAQAAAVWSWAHEARKRSQNAGGTGALVVAVVVNVAEDRAVGAHEVPARRLALLGLAARREEADARRRRPSAGS